MKPRTGSDNAKLKIALFLILTCAAGFSITPETTKTIDSRTSAVSLLRSFKGTFTRPVSANYLVFLPRAYSSRPRDRWPLILFLHGSGERGTDLKKLSNDGPAMMAHRDPDFPFIVVSPQCPEDDWWNNDVLISLLNEVQRKYRVDLTRVYLTGLSMGGYGTWALATEYPDRFAAIAPISGAGYSDCANRLTKLPIWVFHGAKDKLVPPSEAQDMFDTIKKAGGDIKLTMYPDAGHNAWTRTYQNPDFYAWLLQQTRQPSGAAPKPSPKSHSKIYPQCIERDRSLYVAWQYGGKPAREGGRESRDIDECVSKKTLLRGSDSLCRRYS